MWHVYYLSMVRGADEMVRGADEMVRGADDLPL